MEALPPREPVVWVSIRFNTVLFSPFNERIPQWMVLRYDFLLAHFLILQSNEQRMIFLSLNQQ